MKFDILYIKTQLLHADYFFLNNLTPFLSLFSFFPPPTAAEESIFTICSVRSVNNVLYVERNCWMKSLLLYAESSPLTTKVHVRWGHPRLPGILQLTLLQQPFSERRTMFEQSRVGKWRSILRYICLFSDLNVVIHGLVLGGRISNDTHNDSDFYKQWLVNRPSDLLLLLCYNVANTYEYNWTWHSWVQTVHCPLLGTQREWYRYPSDASSALVVHQPPSVALLQRGTWVRSHSTLWSTSACQSCSRAHRDHQRNLSSPSIQSCLRLNPRTFHSPRQRELKISLEYHVVSLMLSQLTVIKHLFFDFLSFFT